MNKALTWILLGAASILGLNLNGCASKTSAIDEKPEPVILPCIIPSDLPNDAMGKLGIKVIQVNDVYRIIVPTDPIFQTRTARIKPSADDGLSQLAIYLQKFKTRMAVTGYTDSLGSYTDDQVLSEQQARSLITYLWTHGVSHECLTPLGIGKDENATIASNRSVEGSVANRRIEITFKARSRYAPI